VDFHLTDEQRLIHQTVRDFAAREIRPHAREWDRQGKFPLELVPPLAELGLWGMTVPAAYGGAGLDMMSIALAIEALASGDGGIALAVASHNSLCTATLSSSPAKSRSSATSPNWRRDRRWAPGV